MDQHECQLEACRRRRGFTLVELILVLVIMGVLAAIAVPRFSQATARQQLEAAADRVVADLNRASTRARAASQTTTVLFNLSSDQYGISAVGGQALTVDLSSPPYEVDITSAKFGSYRYAQFNAFGVPVESGTVVLKRGGSSVTVTLGSNGEAKR